VLILAPGGVTGSELRVRVVYTVPNLFARLGALGAGRYAVAAAEVQEAADLAPLFPDFGLALDHTVVREGEALVRMRAWMP
jgi:hypothetical protein